MITLAKKLKRNGDPSETPERPPTLFSFRDRLLPGQVAELTPEVLPSTAQVSFPHPDSLHKFHVYIRPTEGYWRGGRFEFEVSVPEDYNMSPPKVRCKTIVWHPNIRYRSGSVCLSLLRKSALDDGMGWTPTRSLKDIVLGLDGLFGDLVNFDDPLNLDAAQEFRLNSELFQRKAWDHVRKYAM
ncbi:NEDD8-conjugating enzyme UBE2F [Galendromus occidentalis]|uniref:E2 NEDD8-conjugating enzyme n=1 Tax=Galendromus occidentalis TaxID=34638 RepID=A0AAJ6VZ04_9ACAR|nr:NEDD8-conjugating enzyme UBE2F [Galendromus occidentalis]